jgi:hypothetical protein
MERRVESAKYPSGCANFFSSLYSCARRFWAPFSLTLRQKPNKLARKLVLPLADRSNGRSSIERLSAKGPIGRSKPSQEKLG